MKGCDKMYTCKKCGKTFDLPIIKEAPTALKKSLIFLIGGFFTCGLLWLLSPVALIPQPDIKKCPYCLSKIT
jgi:DNA-directed RNA polymerase subunit RPC12/RpoP